METAICGMIMSLITIPVFLGSEERILPLLLYTTIFLFASLNLSPMMFNTVFDESGFEKTFFFFKKRYDYSEITSCDYQYAYKRGHLYTFHLGIYKDLLYGKLHNMNNFIAAVCEKYRELHDGKELPGIETFPGCENFTEIKIAEPDFSLPESTPLRFADLDAKGRIFLETEIGEYKIVYRRIGRTNELAVNGYVYDEYIKLMEFSHELSANVGGHRFTAGFDSKTAQSFMTVDGVTIKRKTRYI